MNAIEKLFAPKVKSEKIRLRFVEQKANLINLFTDNHGVYKVTEFILLDFITESGMNLQNLWTYNDSPSRDDDPSFDVFTEIEHDAADFLDNNFELVCQSYLNLFNK